MKSPKIEDQLVFIKFSQKKVKKNQLNKPLAVFLTLKSSVSFVDLSCAPGTSSTLVTQGTSVPQEMLHKVPTR